MGEIRCELSWSASRAKTFARCRRCYYYQYYGSWRGWEPGAPAQVRAAYRLKNMTSLERQAGTLVHEAIEGWLQRARGGHRGGAQALCERALGDLDRAWRESEGDGWRRNPKRVARFFEHHYGQPITPEQAARISARIRKSIEAFFTMPELGAVRRSDPRTWLAIEGLDTFQVAGSKVYAVPDFAWRDGEQIAVLDWKTGREREEDRRQVEVYALYAGERWGVPAEQIRLQLVYLPARKVVAVEVDGSELEEVREDIEHSLSIMAREHFDPDRETIPPERFAANGAPQACPHCNFQEICDRQCGDPMDRSSD